jgi:hypothetical protein
LAVVHIRRALLLFAIVIGLAAMTASLSRSGDENTSDRPPPKASAPAEPQTTPSVGVPPAAEPVNTISFDATQDETLRLEAGQAATLEVSVDQPGQVEIPLLGLTTTGLPLTPARFEVLIAEEGRFPIEFTPAEGDEQRTVGTLVVKAPEE